MCTFILVINLWHKPHMLSYTGCWSLQKIMIHIRGPFYVFLNWFYSRQTLAANRWELWCLILLTIKVTFYSDRLKDSGGILYDLKIKWYIVKTCIIIDIKRRFNRNHIERYSHRSSLIVLVVPETHIHTYIYQNVTIVKSYM